MEYVDDTGRRYEHIEEASFPWQPLVRVRTDLDSRSCETWENLRYTVIVQRFDRGFFIKNSEYVRLGIINADNSAHHDWRDFQHIKNQLCGRDWEGIELYPAESRLRDPSNEFFLWCVPRGILKFGLPGGRCVLTPEEAIAPQRPFPT